MHDKSLSRKKLDELVMYDIRFFQNSPETFSLMLF